MIANISLLAQIAVNLVEKYPQACDISLRISNIVDELGIFAQWLIGQENSKELLDKGKTLDELFKLANEQA